MMPKPTISVILPVFNEAQFIEKTLQTLLKQKQDICDIEILVIDGMSTDGSYEIVRKIALQNSSVHSFQNTMRKTPFAFNIGLREAQGEYVAILGAHSEYNPDYLSVCLAELKTHGAVGCSGKLYSKPATQSLQAQISLWVLSHPFGVSGSSFRTQSEGYADTIPYPVFLKRVLLDLGGYDESFTRNQDNDMNYRIRQAGHKLYVTGKTSCVYYTRSSLRGLIDYAYGNGSWCAVSFRTEPKSLGLRHYIPALFLIAVICSTLSAIVGILLHLPVGILVLLLTPIWLHLLIGTVASIQIAYQKKALPALLLAPLFFAFHLTYGYGFLRQFAGIVLKMFTVSKTKIQTEL